MNKPRPDTSSGGKLLKVISERVSECAGRRPSGRMDHQPCRFVYHDKRVVFVNNLKRNIFRNERVCGGRDQLDFDFVLFADFVRRLRRLAINEYVLILDQTLQTCSTPTLDL